MDGLPSIVAKQVLDEIKLIPRRLVVDRCPVDSATGRRRLCFKLDWGFFSSAMTAGDASTNISSFKSSSLREVLSRNPSWNPIPGFGSENHEEEFGSPQSGRGMKELGLDGGACSEPDRSVKAMELSCS